MTRAQESGTPFISLFSPDKITKLALESGFKMAEYVSAEEIHQLYFAARNDDLRAGNAEAFLPART